MGAREYDPALGRFTSADPLKGEPTAPQTRNRYPYVGNNPMTRYDLDGRYWAVEDENGRTVRLDQLDNSANAEDSFYGAGGRARTGADGNGAVECEDQCGADWTEVGVGAVIGASGVVNTWAGYVVVKNTAALRANPASPIDITEGIAILGPGGEMLAAGGAMVAYGSYTVIDNLQKAVRDIWEDEC